MKYNKLVRDKIPDIIEAKGQSAKIHIADEVEYKTKLLEKLMEEVLEFTKDGSPEEMADIQEVLLAIYESRGFTAEQIEAIRADKVLKRGAFSKKIILDET